MDKITTLISKKKIPTVREERSISSVFETAKNSHDSVFVEDNKKRIIGLVSLTNVLFKKRLPPHTKIGHTVVVPPHITKETSIFDAASYMISTGFYTLPVYTNGHIDGIITSKSILKYILENQDILRKVSKKIKLDLPETADIHTKVGEIYKKLKKERSSHIVIVDESGKLAGIVTRKDVKEAFLAPTRGKKRGKNMGYASRSVNFENEEMTRFDFPIGEYMRRDVVTVKVDEKIDIAFKKMLDNDINSIIYVTNSDKPRAILTSYSVLKALSKEKPQSIFELKLTDKDGLVIDEQKKLIRKITERFGGKIDKNDPLKNVEITIKRYRNINAKKTGYEIHLRVHSYDGKGYMTKIESKLLLTGIREAFKKILRQQKG